MNSISVNILRGFIVLSLLAGVAVGSTNSSREHITDELVGQFQEFVEANVDEAVFTEIAQPFLTSTNLENLHLLEAAIEKRVGQLNMEVAAREKQLATSEKQLVTSRMTLSNIQQRIKLLSLTPGQLEAVKEYNRTIVQEPSWFDLLISRVTWFGIITSVFISLLFFFLGEWWQKVKERRKRAISPTDDGGGGGHHRT